MSAYIPTNVISITDGQIFLESDLFFSGVRPAINVGISVSRVGGNAQTKAMKKVAGRLRLDLAQFRELEAFAQFGSELDPATQQALGRGERMVATLNQPQYQPWPFEEQVVAIYAGNNGYLDKVPVGQVPRFQEELRETLRSGSGIYEAIRETKDLGDETVAKLDEALKKFVEGFNIIGGEGARRLAHGVGSGSQAADQVRHATRARSRGRSSSSPPRSSGAPRRGSRRCDRTPTR